MSIKRNTYLPAVIWFYEQNAGIAVIAQSLTVSERQGRNSLGSLDHSFTRSFSHPFNTISIACLSVFYQFNICC